jgi:hypothetical protein
MGHAVAQVRFQRDSLLSEDVIINTFNFRTIPAGAVTAADALSIATRLKNFYDFPHVPTNTRLGTYMSSILAPSGHSVRVYDMGDPKPRQPRLTYDFTMATTAGTSLPAEVALVLTEYATQPSGAVPARYRGRVYLGPFASNTLGTTDIGDVRPSDALRNSILDASKQLMDDGTVVNAPVWCVYSRLDLMLRTVVRTGVDNAWDTQRSRGADPTTRLLRNIGAV